MRFVTFSDLLSGPFVTPWQCPYFGTSGTPCDAWPTNQLKLYSTSVIVCFKTSSQIQWYAMLICLVQLVTWSGVSIIQMLEVLYSYNLRFSHVSQTTVNWTSEVFHNRSWPAMNFLSKQVVDFFWAYRRILTSKWTYFGTITSIFHLWTWPDNIHDHHTSHPVNLRL